MSAHDRAAARHARRFTLTAIRYSRGCMQTAEFPGLTEREVLEQMAYEREKMPTSPYGDRVVTFETDPSLPLVFCATCGGKRAPFHICETDD